jgi:hypothetical protein
MAELGGAADTYPMGRSEAETGRLIARASGTSMVLRGREA